MLSRERGFTLMEMMVVTVIAMIVAAGIITMDAGRTRLGVQLLENSKQASEEQQAGVAAIQLGKDLERADRVNILNTGVPGVAPFGPPAGFGNVQIRTPVGCMGAASPAPACFDDPTNYAWVQYRRVGNDLLRYDDTGSGCGSVRTVARQLGATPQNDGFEFFFQDTTAGAPTWGVQADEVNVFNYTITWDNGLLGPNAKEHTFDGNSTMRNFGYMNVNRGIAGPGDSGTGLAVSTPLLPDLMPPPGGC